MGKAYDVSSGKYEVAKKAYVVEGSKYVKLPKTFVVEGGKYVKLWSGGGLHVAPGPNYSLTSEDGINWTETYTGVGFNSNIGHCFYVNGKYVVHNESGVIYYSGDGITWTRKRVTVSTSNISSILFFANKQLIMLDNENYLYTSSDAINWTNISASGLYTAIKTADGDLVYGKYNGAYQYVCICQNYTSGAGLQILTSSDLKTWTSAYKATTYSSTTIYGESLCTMDDGTIYWLSHTDGMRYSLHKLSDTSATHTIIVTTDQLTQYTQGIGFLSWNSSAKQVAFNYNAYGTTYTKRIDIDDATITSVTSGPSGACQLYYRCGDHCCKIGCSYNGSGLVSTIGYIPGESFSGTWTVAYTFYDTTAGNNYVAGNVQYYKGIIYGE